MSSYKQNRIVKRCNIYYYRRRVPSLLKHIFQKSEFVVSLKTSCFSDAQKLSFRYDSYFNNLITNELLKAMAIPYPNLKNINKLTVNDNGIQITPEDIAALKAAGVPADRIENIILTALARSSFAHARPALPPQETSPVPSPVSNDHYPLLSEAIDLFWADVLRHDPEYTITDNQKTWCRRLVEIMGDKPINIYTVGNANNVVEKLKLLPNKPKIYGNKTVQQILDSIEGLQIPRLSKTTINNHTELYKRLFDFIIKSKYKNIENIFGDTRIKIRKKEKANKARDSFTLSDLDAIFSTPIFTQGKYNKNFQFWAPLIALYTGARRAEIASLYVSDIKNIDDIYCFDFNEDTPDKRLKSVCSFRKTPIHPSLIKLGFLDFVATLDPKGRLFPELTNYDKDEGYGRNIGDYFSGYLKKIGVYVERKKVFHSFRHTFISRLRNYCRVDLSIISELAGHEPVERSVTQIHYVDDAHLPLLYSEIIKLDFSKQIANVARKS